VQEAVDQATMLSLGACGLGVAFVTDATRWRCPKDVVLRRVVDLRLPITVSLIWRKDNGSPLLARFVAHVRQLAEVRTPTPTLPAPKATPQSRSSGPRGHLKQDR